MTKTSKTHGRATARLGRVMALVLAVGSASALPACVIVPARATYVVESEPPPPRVEVVPAPRAGYVWVRGYWQWRGGNWQWRQGYWQRSRGATYYWVDGHWERRGRRHHWVEGHWERARGREPGVRRHDHRR